MADNKAQENAREYQDLANLFMNGNGGNLGKEATNLLGQAGRILPQANETLASTVQRNLRNDAGVKNVSGFVASIKSFKNNIKLWKNSNKDAIHKIQKPRMDAKPLHAVNQPNFHRDHALHINVDKWQEAGYNVMENQNEIREALKQMNGETTDAINRLKYQPGFKKQCGF